MALYRAAVVRVAGDHRGNGSRRSKQARNPRDVKVAFAQEIVARFHDRAAADKALADFEARFKQGEIPENLEEVKLTTGTEPMLLLSGSQAGRLDRQHVRGDAHDRAGRGQSRRRESHRQDRQVAGEPGRLYCRWASVNSPKSRAPEANFDRWSGRTVCSDSKIP